MSETGAARAWQFLKRNPDYLAKWRNTADVAPAIKAAPFPLRSQTPADLKAAAWGVLAWEVLSLPTARSRRSGPRRRCLLIGVEY